MTENQDFTSSKKRVRIFVYEFDGYFSGDPTVLGTDGVIKEEGGFFLILASILFVLSLLLLGIDLALSPLLGLKHITESTEPQLPTRQDFPVQRENVIGRERFSLPRSQLNDQGSSTREQERGAMYGAAFRESTRNSSRRHYNSPVSRETSFTTTSNLRPREYWL